MLLRYVGSASVSCCCRAARYEGEQSLRVLFHNATNMSSKGRKTVTRWTKPASGGCGSVGSSAAVGRLMVAWRVKGRCRWRAYALFELVQFHGILAAKPTVLLQTATNTSAVFSTTRSDRTAYTSPPYSCQGYEPMSSPPSGGTRPCYVNRGQNSIRKESSSWPNYPNSVTRDDRSPSSPLMSPPSAACRSPNSLPACCRVLMDLPVSAFQAGSS